MADTKLSALTELAAKPAVDDEVYIRDVSEAAAAESKRITIANLLAGLGDVSGPGSSVDNAIARFHETTGKIIQGYTSGAPNISDVGIVALPGQTTTKIYLDDTFDPQPMPTGRRPLNG